MHFPNFLKTHRKSIIFVGLILLVPFLLLLLRSPSEQEQYPLPPQSSTPKWQTYDELVLEKKLAPAQKILEVGLEYNATSSPQLKFTRFAQKNGYVPSPQQHNTATHTLQLLAQNGQIISQKPFSIPNKVHMERFEKDGSITGEIAVRTYFPFAFTLPWFNHASSIQITDQSGKVIVSSPLSNVQIRDNKPNFLSIQGDQFTKQQKPKINFNKFLSSPLYAAGGKLNIAVISDKYADSAAFQRDLDIYIRSFLELEPLKTRASQISFNAAFNTSDLQCVQDGERGISCNEDLIVQQVNQAGTPHDVIAVVTNLPNLSIGSANPLSGIFMQSNFKLDEEDRYTFVHEFGHAFALLLDEYKVIEENGVVDNKIHRAGIDASDTFDPPGDGNCYAGNPPAADWNPIVSTGDYHKICHYPNWYASSKTSVMYTLSDPCFNAVSQGVLNRRLDAVAGNFAGGPVALAPCPNVSPTNAPTATAPTEAPTISVPTVAPSGVVPTYQCLGGVPCTPSETPTPIPTQPNAIPPTLPPVGGTQPTAVPNIGVAQPCATIQTAIQTHGKKKKKGNNQGNGFIKAILKFIIGFIDLLLRLIFGGGGGGGPIPCNPIGIVPTVAPQPTSPPQPTSGVQPTVAPQPTDIPSVTPIPDGFTPHATLPTGTFKTCRPNITVDTLAAPDLDVWLRTKVVPTLTDWYPYIADNIATPDYTPFCDIKIIFADIEEPARVDFATGAITADTTWAKNHPEDMGLYIHESTHSIQAYAKRPEGWVTEAIADWTRNYLYIDRVAKVPTASQYFIDGYSEAGYMFQLINTKYDKNFIRKINVASHKGTYNYDIFSQTTGKPLDQIWTEATGHVVPAGPLKGIGGKCLDIPNGVTEDGVLLQLWACNSADAQRWSTAPSPNDPNARRIVARGKCMDVTQSGTADGTSVWLFSCNRGAAQDWVPQANGTLINPIANKCLSANNSSGADGTKIMIATCNASQSQQIWNLPK